jgi:pimeloyl-ACP methyl ester carboxylesterase
VTDLPAEAASPPPPSVPTRSFRVTLRHLDTHVTEWLPPAGHAPRDTVLLFHGFADAGGSFDLVAPRLAADGYRVVAPDFRGFGQTAWTPPGSYYHFPEYVADAQALARALDLTTPIVVGHSMGGSVATLFAGARAVPIRALALLEGLGPPSTDLAYTPDRFHKWLDDLVAPRALEQRPMDNAAGVLARLVLQHPLVPRAVLATRVPVLARDLGDGRFVWRFDPLHRSSSPTPFLAEMYRAFLARLDVPTLIVGGGPEGYHPPDEAERIAAVPNATHLEIAGAGHMMHWTKPAELSAALLGFFGSLPPRTAP